MTHRSPERPFSALVVAGTHSGVGKTSVTLGLIGALRRRALTVQPFKVGPDFIDPLHHRAASGRDAINLDGWMLEPAANREAFARATADADVAVVEGVMGLYDGSEGRSDRGSTAEMAKLLGLPVILVIDASAMARSAAALIHGYATFDPELLLAGVILNNVGGPGHADLIRDAVAGRFPILGALPRVPEATIAERHLGLHLPSEIKSEHRELLADLIDQHLDLDALLQATQARRPEAPPPPEARGTAAVRIGIARDDAFCFYYADNLRLLEEAGAQLIEFSPLHDPLPTGLDALYLGGGYPELHAERLAANTGVRTSIREFAAAGGPIYAECGGLMYLGDALEIDGRRHAQCGVLPYTTRMPARLTLAYVEITTTGGLFGAGHRARGHVYHHSEIVQEPTLDRVYEIRTVQGETRAEGYSAGNILASYAHLHFGSSPRVPVAIVAQAQRWSELGVSGKT